MRHHIQKAILYSLSFSDAVRFSDLKPDTLENKLFDYHLKQLMRDKLVTKTDDGKYKLTTEGRLLGRNVYTASFQDAETARSVLILAVKHQETKQWLYYKRKTHPLKDQYGFLHCTPEKQTSIFETSASTIKKLGLRGDFELLGGGFLRGKNQEGTVESFTNFTLLFSKNTTGILEQTDERADYFWVDHLDPHAPRLIQNMPMLIEKILENKPFIIEHDFLLKITN